MTKDDWQQWDKDEYGAKFDRKPTYHFGKHGGKGKGSGFSIRFAIVRNLK